LFYQVVWRNEFRFFEDKSAAINPETGVNDELREMLTKWCCPGYKLAVGKSEYKTIIEASLVSVKLSYLFMSLNSFEYHFCYCLLQDITCLHNDAVMEVMWGLKNLMHSLVPEEKLQLSKEDRLQMSQGLEMLLKRYGVDVEPEMVSLPLAFSYISGINRSRFFTFDYWPH
jgi:nucleolar protein 58